MRNPLTRNEPDPNDPHDPANDELTADERARAAGTSDVPATGDTHVAGPPPAARPDVSPARPTDPEIPREQIATQFPSPPGGAREVSEPGDPGRIDERDVVDEPGRVDKPGLADKPGRAAKPGLAEDSPVDRLLDRDEAQRFHERWRDVQAAFVDDPHEAVRNADELAAEVVNALGQALTSHKRTLDERWRNEKDERHDTENLRLALRGYRSFLERMLDS